MRSASSSPDTSAAVVATSEPMPSPVAKRSQPKAADVVAIAVNAEDEGDLTRITDIIRSAKEKLIKVILIADQISPAGLLTTPATLTHWPKLTPARYAALCPATPRKSHTPRPAGQLLSAQHKPATI